MNELQLIVLAVVQGLTEFLPISSSGHLVLIPHVTGWPDQGLAFDIAAHLGSLVAVVFYLAPQLRQLTSGFFLSLSTRELNPDARLAWAVLLGTIPVGLVGLAAHDFIGTHLRTTFVIAMTTIVFGLALLYADVRGQRTRALAQLQWRDVLLIGLAQALALIPGTSRSGITMTAALLLGLNREASARFSFLLSIPVIVLASGKETLDLINTGMAQPWLQLFSVAAFSAVSAYACIYLFMQFIERLGMWPFALYRLLLGAVLLLVF